MSLVHVHVPHAALAFYSSAAHIVEATLLALRVAGRLRLYLCAP